MEGNALLPLTANLKAECTLFFAYICSKSFHCSTIFKRRVVRWDGHTIQYVIRAYKGLEFKSHCHPLQKRISHLLCHGEKKSDSHVRRRVEDTIKSVLYLRGSHDSTCFTQQYLRTSPDTLFFLFPIPSFIETFLKMQDTNTSSGTYPMFEINKGTCFCGIWISCNFNSRRPPHS